jgi:DNA repair protein RecO (recombination protein O)
LAQKNQNSVEQLGKVARFYKTEGIVLRSIATLESDRLITLLSPDLGKLRIMVRGARKVNSRLGGHLDVLNRVIINFSEGRTFYLATGVQTLEAFGFIKKDLDRVATALYLSELTDKLTPEGQAQPDVYPLLLRGFRHLNENGLNPIIARYTELHLLSESGYLPELNHCVQCERELLARPYGYSPGSAGIICNRCFSPQAGHFPLTQNALKVLRFLASNSFSEACRLRIDLSLERELENLIGSSIQYVLDHELGTASFIEHLKALN